MKHIFQASHADAYNHSIGARVTGAFCSSPSTDLSSRQGLITRDDIVSSPSTPLFAPSYPSGPYHFTDREYFIIAYETDFDRLASCVPVPLKPKSNVVYYEWINMDSTGLGYYKESGTVIPCITPNGEEVNYTLQMFLDCEPPIAAGREIWGFPKKYADPTFRIIRDTVTGTLDYAGQRVATGTMAYKFKKIPDEEAIRSLTKKCVNLKMIPDVNHQCKVAQLVQYSLTDVKLKFAYEGPARLDLIPHINAPTAYLPVRKVLGGKHIMADITLPYGSVMHDYMKDPSFEHPIQITAENDQVIGETLSRADIVQNPVMPLLAPSFKNTSSYLADRHYFIVRYKTDPGVLQRHVPDKFYVNAGNEIIVQWVKTQSTGMGQFSKVDIIIPVSDDNGNHYHFALVSFMNSSAPITYGREIYGQPQKYAHPACTVLRDTITGTLDYSESRVATATMSYKHKQMPVQHAIDYLSKRTMTVKLIPDADGGQLVAQLVEIDFSNITVQDAYEGAAAIDLIPHVHAPLADIPVREVIGGCSFKCDLVMAGGRVYHDYLKRNNE